MICEGNGLSRPEALAALGVLGATLACTPMSRAMPTTPRMSGTSPGEPSTKTGAAHALTGNPTLAPLPFNPAFLNGLSERLPRSHHENNYGGAVRNLNRAEQEFLRITADTPPFVVAALRDRELTFRNSMILHEASFAVLGGDGKRNGAIETALAEAYGPVAAGELNFRATALGLGGGSGWVILALELDTRALRTSVPATTRSRSRVRFPCWC